MNPIGDNARLLSNDELAKWLIEDFPFRIQLSPEFPFHPVTGDALRYATTGPLKPGVALGQGDLIPEDTKQPEAPNRCHQFAEIATHFRVTYKAQDIFSSNVNDQVAVQMALGVRELLYRFWTMFESGSAAANPDEFDGLLQLVAPQNVVDLNGQGLTLEAMDQAKDKITSNDGRDVRLFTSGIGKRAIDASHWVRGLTPQYEEIDIDSPDGSFRTEQVVTFDGAPVFINDLNQVFIWEGDHPSELIPLEDRFGCDGIEPPLATNIWFFVLGQGNLHGIIPAKAGNIITRSTILADASTLVYHLTMPTGIALGSLGALSVIKNATIPRG